jgi:hypothetical protein
VPRAPVRTVLETNVVLSTVIRGGTPGTLIEYRPRTQTHLEFTSTQFPALPEEDERVNPGLYGKRLAAYLSSELPGHGFAVTHMNPEDWGWRIDLENAAFPLLIGCGASGDPPERFLIFSEPSRPFIRRLFRRIPTTAVVERLASTLHSILAQSGMADEIRRRDPDEVTR